jgi:hypothetical protein
MITDEEFALMCFRNLFKRCYRIEMEPREVEYLSNNKYRKAYNHWYLTVYLPSMG